jgi:hypothetical protein
MPKVLYCNAVEVSHNREAFCLVFRFQSPDRHQETVYISISPAGARTTVNLINREVADYERETRQTVTPWPVEPNLDQAKNHLSI